MGQRTSKSMIHISRVVNKNSKSHLDRYTYYDVTVDPDFITLPEENETFFSQMLRCVEKLQGTPYKELLRGIERDN